MSDRRLSKTELAGLRLKRALPNLPVAAIDALRERIVAALSLDPVWFDAVLSREFQLRADMDLDDQAIEGMQPDRPIAVQKMHDTMRTFGAEHGIHSIECISAAFAVTQDLNDALVQPCQITRKQAQALTVVLDLAREALEMLSQSMNGGERAGARQAIAAVQSFGASMPAALESPVPEVEEALATAEPANF